MSPTIEIPAPLEQDSDSVVTALETAAVFANRGDAVEALRWLKRAAESAGDSGDDVRTLTLARSAADLTNQIQAAASAPAPAPQPAPRSFTPPVSSPSTAARTTPIALTGSPGPRARDAAQTPRRLANGPAARTPMPPVAAHGSNDASPNNALANNAASNRVSSDDARANVSANNTSASKSSTNDATRGSARWLPKPPARAAVGAERLTSRPPPPSSRPFTTPAPPPVEVRPVREILSNSMPPPTARESAVPGRDTLAPSRDSLTPARDTLTSPISAGLIHSLPTPSVPAVALATSDERRSAVPEALRSARPERASDSPRFRQAARVSIVPSSTERGLYLVRLLEEGHAAPADGAEGFLVLVDPNAGVFSR